MEVVYLKAVIISGISATDETYLYVFYIKMEYFLLIGLPVVLNLRPHFTTSSHTNPYCMDLVTLSKQNTIFADLY